MAKKSKKNTGQAVKTFIEGTNTTFSTTLSPCSACTKACSCSDCPKRVLIVGGIERMEPLYREVIEAKGHQFEYHAGHLRKGGNKLENCLLRADIILCPINCNSHNACLQVKCLCKKHKKNLQLMRNFSLSAIDRAV